MNELITAIKNGDEKRLVELYERNTGLLFTLARRYIGIDYAVTEDDLIQAGFLGLLAAVDAWTPDKGAWSTVAYWYVQRAMRQAVGINSTRRRAHLGAVSLDEPIPGSEDGDATRADLLADESLPEADEDLLQAEIVTTVRAAVDAIPDARQSQVVRLRHLEGRTGRQVGDMLGCSHERVRQLEREGFKALRRDKRLRALMRAYQLDEETRFYAHKGVTAFNSDWMSVTEGAALWRIERRHA